MSGRNNSSISNNMAGHRAQSAVLAHIRLRADISCLPSLKKLAVKFAHTFRYSHQKMDIGAGSFSFATPLTDRYLKTYDVIGCIALSVYCSDTKEGALAHILSGTPEIEAHLKADIKPLFKGQRFEIRIISPHATEEFRRDVASAVKEVFGCEVNQGKEDEYCTTFAVMLDTENGSVAVQRQTDPWVSQFVNVRSEKDPGII